MQPIPMLGSGEATFSPLAVAADTAMHVQGPEGLDRVAEPWERLDLRSTIPWTNHPWAKSLACALVPGQRLHVFAASSEDGSLAIAALMRPDGPFSALSALGAGALGGPTDFAHADPAALGAVCRAIARAPFPLHLARVPARSPTILALREAYEGRGIVLERPERPVLSLPIDATWIDPERRLGARERSFLRRARRRADRLGAVSCGIFAPGPRELSALLDEAFEIEAATSHGRSRARLARDAVTEAFLRAYADEVARRGGLRIGLLRIGGRAAAMQIGAQQGGRYWLLKMSFDGLFASAAPGLLLFCESLRSAAREGLSSYEILSGSAPWLKPWGPRRRACVSVSAYPASLRGLSALGGWALARMARAVARRFMR